jgi:hypothetical protein
MADREEQVKQMDEAAREAEGELQGKLTQWSAMDLINWWGRWYLKAGHKRLGRALVRIGKGNRK